jgi:pilus assembly protein FimV
MNALKAFVTDGPRASEAPYLMWLKIASQFGTDADRTAATSFYESHFQRLAPSLTAIESPLGLDDDASCVQSLVREWPSEAARQVLLAALSSQPGEVKGALRVRTLRAFDDLVMLAGMLDNLASSDPTPVNEMPLDTGVMLEELDTVYPPWEAAHEVSPVAKPAPGAMLDLDLSGMSDPPVAKPVQPTRPAPQAVDFDLFELEPKKEKPAGEDSKGIDPKG